MTPTSSRPHLWIPVEVKARELKSRLLVAAKACRAGFGVDVLRSRDLHRHPERLPPGVILENDATIASAPFARRARSAGHRLVAWDEEAIAVLSDAWYVRQRVSSETVDYYDHLFSRGPGDCEAIQRAIPAFAGRVSPAGNPRLDLLHPSVVGPVAAPADDAPIVVMSRFARSNPFAVTTQTARLNAHRKFKFAPDDGAFYDGYLDHCDTLYRLMLEMTGRLARRFEQRLIVVRPHPSEGLKAWEDLAARHHNIRVSVEGTAVDLSLRAAAIVHNGCTTGLEAALLGRPVFAFVPRISEKYDVALPNHVSECHATEAALFDAIQGVLRGPQPEPREKAVATWALLEDGWIGDGSRRLSSDIMVEALERSYRHSLPPVRGRISRRAFAALKSTAVATKNALSGLRTGRNTSAAAYYDRKFPRTDVQEINSLLSELGFLDVRAIERRPFRWTLRCIQEAWP